MIQFVVKSNSYSHCPMVFTRKKVDEHKVAEYIYEITGFWEKGIEAEGWCELAAVGEVYEDDSFTISVIDE